MKKIFYLPLLFLSFLSFSCNLGNSDYGAVAFVFPSSVSRAADLTENYTYKLKLTTSDNAVKEIEAKGGDSVVEDGIRIGMCQIDAEVYYGEAVVPMYTGSSSVYIQPSQVNKATIKVSKVDYSKTLPVGFNLKMAGGLDYCSNIHKDLSDLRIQRIFMDGSTDEEYISPLGLYSISFDEAPETSHSVGFYPVTLKGDNNFVKTIMLPVYYSVFKGKAADDYKLEVNVSEYSKTATSSNTDFSASIESFILQYRSRAGIKTDINITPELSGAKWINDQEELPVEGVEYSFKPTKTGTYKIHFEATVTAEDDTASGCVVNDWLKDNSVKTEEITKEITRIKGDDVDLGHNSGGAIDINPPYKDNRFNIIKKVMGTAGDFSLYLEYDEETYGVIDNTLYHYFWKMDGVPQTPVEDLTVLPLDYFGRRYSGLYFNSGEVEYGRHYVECFVQYPAQNYIELCTFEFTDPLAD